MLNIKKTYSLLIIVLMLSTLSATAQQYQALTFDYEKSYFGENEPLPAEKYFMLTGAITSDIYYVEVKLLEANDKHRDRPLYVGHWKRGFQNQSSLSYNIPINYSLRQKSEYDVHISFFRFMEEYEMDGLKDYVYQGLENYISQAYKTSGQRLKLLNNNKKVVEDLNSIVEERLSTYRMRTQVHFEGFSDMVLEKVKEIERFKMPKERKKEGKDPKGADRPTREELLESLIKLVKGEMERYFEMEMYVLLDDRFIDDYPTEKTQSVIAVNAGYAGIPLSFNSNFNYTSAPYVGLSFPLGKKAFSPFWHRTAVSMGVFIPVLRDRFGTQVEAPFTKIPVYAALSYRPWRFLRVHAGATVLEQPTSVSVPGLNRPFNVRPFVGVSIELNWWMDFAK